MNITKKDALHLIDLLDSGTAKDVDLFMESLVLPEGKWVLCEVERILKEINSGSTDVEADIEGELASTAAFKCQDAMEQLVYLVEEGKKTAHLTLEITEQVKVGIQKLKMGEGSLENICDEINTLLMDLMVLQGYQDLAEQVIIKLKRFVGNLEQNLAQVVDLNMAREIELEMGPSVTEREEAYVINDQDLIDELINGGKGA